MSIIRFEKYDDAGTGNYTEVEVQNQYQLANALTKVLTNRRKGYPRVVRDIEGNDDDIVITIDTNRTTTKDRTANRDPLME